MDPETFEQKWDQMETLLQKMQEQHNEAKARFGEEVPGLRQAMDELQERMAEMETRFNRPAPIDARDPEHEAEVKAFLNYLRKGERGLSSEDQKALSGTSGADGGFLIPHPIKDRLREVVAELSPVRARASVVTIERGDSIEVPTDEGAWEANWVGETDTRSTTAQGNLRQKRITAHEQYAQPAISQAMLDDTEVDVEAWISRQTGLAFAKAEGAAFVAGDGNNKPEGVTNAAGVTEVNAAAAAVFTADEVIELTTSIPTAYAQQAVLSGNRVTLRALRQLKDQQDQYLWQPALQAGLPALFGGHPVIEMPDLPNAASGTSPLIFVNWEQAYTIVDKAGVGLIRDALTNKPFVNFYTTRRVGGGVTVREAAARMVMA